MKVVSYLTLGARYLCFMDRGLRIFPHILLNIFRPIFFENVRTIRLVERMDCSFVGVEQSHSTFVLHVTRVLILDVCWK